MTESNEEYFKRRHGERNAQEVTRGLQESKALQQWQTRLDRLVEQFDPEVRGLLAAFAAEAPEIGEYKVRGPEQLRNQVNWWIEYTTGEGHPEKTILVVLHYLRRPGADDEWVPDYFSLEGLVGPTTIKPPTIEALRKALGDARFRA